MAEADIICNLCQASCEAPAGDEQCVCVSCGGLKCLMCPLFFRSDDEDNFNNHVNEHFEEEEIAEEQIIIPPPPQDIICSCNRSNAPNTINCECGNRLQIVNGNGSNVFVGRKVFFLGYFASSVIEEGVILEINEEEVGREILCKYVSGQYKPEWCNKNQVYATADEASSQQRSRKRTERIEIDPGSTRKSTDEGTSQQRSRKSTGTTEIDPGSTRKSKKRSASAGAAAMEEEEEEEVAPSKKQAKKSKLSSSSSSSSSSSTSSSSSSSSSARGNSKATKVVVYVYVTH